MKWVAARGSRSPVKSGGPRARVASARLPAALATSAPRGRLVRATPWRHVLPAAARPRRASRATGGRNYNVKDVSRAWPYGAWVSLYMRRCARRIAEMAPRSPLALPSRPDRQGSVQLHAPARGIAITPPHHFTKSTNPYSRPRALTRDAQARRCPRANQPRAPAR